MHVAHDVAVRDISYAQSVAVSIEQGLAHIRVAVLHKDVLICVTCLVHMHQKCLLWGGYG